MSAADPFDAYSDRRYDQALQEALSVSGESKEFFARGRVGATRDLLEELGAPARGLRVLDFGCGVGDTAPILRDTFEAARVVGIDPSAPTIEYGNKSHKADVDEGRVALMTNGAIFDVEPEASFDLCYTNGVVHHIPPRERAAAMDLVRRALKPGGRFFLWENHPGNPGTRFIMARCAFDDDAVPVWPHQARRLLRDAGFVVERTTYRFLFPKALSFLRPLEERLLKLPIGAQYAVVAQKPVARKP